MKGRKIKISPAFLVTLGIIFTVFLFFMLQPRRIINLSGRLADFFREKSWELKTARNFKEIEQRAAAPRGRKMPPGEKPSLIFIIIDTCRPDRLGCYGYEKKVSPAIDALARDGILFSSVVCQAPITMPSHASIMTALYPPAHGVRDNGRFRLDESFPTLAEMLKRAGYVTGAVVGSFVLDSRFGLDQGFDFYGDTFAKPASRRLCRAGWQGHEVGIFERSAEEVTLEALRWLEECPEQPFFLFIHYYDPHQPLCPPRRYRERFPENPYDGEIAFVDDCLGYLVRYLENSGLAENALLVVTSDHGESLGEHGYRGHAGVLYEQTLLIPWIIRDPQTSDPGKVIRQQVESVDILPTTLEMLGIFPPPDIHGKSRASLLKAGSKTGNAFSYSETLFPRLRGGRSELYSLRSPAWKLIRAVSPEGEIKHSLYHLEQDPSESVDLASRRPEKLAQLSAQLEKFKKFEISPRFRYMISMDAETKNKLRALGYIDD